MENFQESWLMSQQAGVSGLCEKFHLYRLEKLVAISKFLDSYFSRIVVVGGGGGGGGGRGGGKITRLVYLHPGGQDKPAGICCPPGVKITRVGGRISRDRLPPRGATCPWLACPLGGPPVQGAR